MEKERFGLMFPSYMKGNAQYLSSLKDSTGCLLVDDGERLLSASELLYLPQSEVVRYFGALQPTIKSELLGAKVKELLYQ